ncbi:jg26748 [Pararge aegeria aegeria]|uniref:Jg26748 protein n=1 Tax=Pararge aegeria aegeria TaxID=348720 RepID=A0A8S4S9R6_9NEOP|nr:jg26748 [Pararge aegeria aegeria]
MTTRTKRNFICSVCTHSIKNNEYLLCAGCANVLDIKCASVTLKRFNTMSSNNKMKWKCHKCRIVKNASQNDKSTAQGASSNRKDDTKTENNVPKTTQCIKLLNQSLENITCSSIEDLHYSTLKDVSTCSLPDMSTDNSQIYDLKENISTLSCQLESAHAEIEKLNIENSNLRKQIEENEKQIKVLKTILNDDVTSSNSTPTRAINKKKRNKLTLSIKTPISNPLNLNGSICFSTPTTIVDKDNFSTPKEFIKETSAVTSAGLDLQEVSGNQTKKIDASIKTTIEKLEVKSRLQNKKPIVSSKKIIILSDTQLGVGLGARMTDYRVSGKTEDGRAFQAFAVRIRKEEAKRFVRVDGISTT